jgi:hypothetical protein
MDFSHLKSDIPLQNNGDHFMVGQKTKNPSAVDFEFIPKRILFPLREGEDIRLFDAFSVGDVYSLTYPGTASMKLVVVFTENDSFLVGGQPDYDYTRIELVRLDQKRFRLSFISRNQRLWIVPFTGDWQTAAVHYKRLAAIRTAEPFSGQPRFMLQLGVKNQLCEVNIKHFSELIPVVERFHALFGPGHIVHFFGTNTAGFDRRFPDYTIDPGLGGEDAFRSLIAAANALDLQTSHHYNPRIADKDWLDEHPEFYDAVVRSVNGMVEEPYKGAPHCVMNPNHEGWYQRCFESIDYLNGLGLDYLEIDQFTYQRNFDVTGEPLAIGYRRMVEDFYLRGIKFWLEGVSDVFRLQPGNFYQILIRDRAQRWEDGENRRGYPFGRSYAEFFMTIYPDAEVSHQIFTEHKRRDQVAPHFDVARSIGAAIYDMELGFFDDEYLPNLNAIAEIING